MKYREKDFTDEDWAEFQKKWGQAPKKPTFEVAEVFLIAFFATIYLLCILKVVGVIW